MVKHKVNSNMVSYIYTFCSDNLSDIQLSLWSILVCSGDLAWHPDVAQFRLVPADGSKGQGQFPLLRFNMIANTKLI